MRKILLLIIIILSLSGCRQPGAEPIDEPEVYLDIPIIKFTSGYGYNDNSFLTSQSVTITENSFEATGSSILLEITFRGPMDPESIVNSVSLDGHDDYTVERHPTRSSAVLLQARDVDYERPYCLLINKDIKDLAGATLAEDISIDIMMHPVPMVYYHYEDALGEKVILGEHTNSYENVHYNQPLSADRAVFTLEFNSPVDQEHVEDAVRNCFSERESLNYNWIKNQRLELTIGNLKANHEYRIMFNRETADSLMLVGTLFFEYYEPTKLMSYDLTSGESEVLKAFVDRPAMVIPCNAVEQVFIVDDYFGRYVLELDKDTTKPLPSDRRFGFGSRNYGWYSLWLDSVTVLTYDEVINRIDCFNIETGESKILFTLPDALTGHGSLELKLSPDKSKLALTSNRLDAGLFVYEISG